MSNSAGIVRARIWRGIALGVLASCGLPFTPIGHAQSVEAGFVAKGEFHKPTFDPGDEQVARDFAKANGVKFNADMELPSCIWRARMRSAGGYADGFTGDKGYAVFARIPVPAAGTRFENLTFSKSPTSYRPEFPREAFIQFDGVKNEQGELDWEATLVLPPMDAKDYPLGPPFRVAKVVLGGYEFPASKITVTRGMPTRIALPDLPKALAAWDGKGGFDAMITPLAPAGDHSVPRVTLHATYAALPQDLADMRNRIAAMVKRNAAGNCAVFPRECRDGECGL